MVIILPPSLQVSCIGNVGISKTSMLVTIAVTFVYNIGKSGGSSSTTAAALVMESTEVSTS
jgi:hypothetical protein